MKIERHVEITEHNQGTALSILSACTDLTNTALKQVMNKGAVWLSRNNNTRRIRRADKKLTSGDVLHLYFDETVLAQTPAAARLIADEGDYSVWYKPYGMLCQGSKWGDHCTINRWVECQLNPQRPAFIVHRLDRAATGLIIIAHKKKVAAYFSDIFQNRKIEKSYQAIVCGQFDGYKKIDTTIEGKHSVSHVRSIGFDQVKDQSLVDVRIETGRKHQIRRHLSESGFPIVGDRLYGTQAVSGDGNMKNLQLRSCYLAFMPPGQSVLKEYTLKGDDTLASEFMPPSSE